MPIHNEYCTVNTRLANLFWRNCW